ncbi:phosphotransferase enzyme family protein [Alteribacter natronophilus]|uniref:phosphotransferase enzyme family protein n=1 Tax=Alteribacter natronophilus TaxID=2583810 RepID=UPI00148630F8|nr:phosphotransferase [Alteribacter natronophilus]
METYIDQLFTDDVFLEGIRKFGVEKVRKVGDFENYVFEGVRGSRNVILRFTHSSHRDYEEVASELDWLMFLSGKGAGVSPALTSVEGRLIETAAVKDSTFYVTLFEKAQGSPVKIKEKLEDIRLIHAWGRETGRLHRLTKQYKPPAHIRKRADLVESFETQFAPFLPHGDKKIVWQIRNVIDTLKQIPKTHNRYQLIHTDLHSGNFFYDGSTINIFDFDDSAYHFLASDIAIPLYYSMLHIQDDHARAEKAKRFLSRFMQGYTQYSEMPPQLFKDLPHMLRFRDCELFGVLHKKWDVENLTPERRQFLNGIRSRLESGRAIVTIQI